MRPLLSLLAAVAIATALLYYALRGVDTDALRTTLAAGDYSSLGFFALALAVFYGLKALRWAMLLAPLGRYSWRDVAPAMMIGFAGNNVLPSHLGELVRTIVFSKRSGLAPSGVLISQVIERMLDVAAVLALYFVALPFMDKAPDALRVSAWVALLASVFSAGMVALLLVRPQWLFKLWAQCAAALPDELQHRGHAVLENGVLALHGLRSPRRVALLLANSIGQWSAMAFAIWISLLTFGTSIEPPLALITLAATVVATTLPSLPGYFGSIQAAFVFVLVPFGVAQESALAASVYFLVAQWIPVTLVGGVCFVLYGLGVSEVKRQIEAAQRVDAHP